jgi:hypothetical protein
MRSAEELLGIWSVDAYYAPGAMEDMVLVFKESGEGWINFINAFADDYITFQWEITAEGFLTIRGDLEYSENTEAKKSDFVLKDVKFQIKHEDRPLSNDLKVLILSEPIFMEMNFGFLMEGVS